MQEPEVPRKTHLCPLLQESAEFWDSTQKWSVLQTFLTQSHCQGFFPHLVQIFNCHVDGNGAKRILQDLSSKVSCFYTGVATLIKFRLVVVDVDDVDLDFCCGVGKHSVDVFFGLSSLRFNKYS